MKMSRETVEQFLAANFSIVEDLTELPPAVVKGFTERGGSRLVMANPGEKYQNSDLVFDTSLPRSRLVFAGVTSDRGFVHYETSDGLSTGYGLTLFRVTSDEGLTPVWRGGCRSFVAKNLEELKSMIANGTCFHSFSFTPFVQPPISADGSTVFPAKKKIIPVKFTYINCDEPVCTLPAVTIAVSRAVGEEFVPVDEGIYSTQQDHNSKFSSDPSTGQYVYNIAASRLGVGKYRVDFESGGLFVGHATFAIK